MGAEALTMYEGNYPVVNTHNEWDPLEEIIVGVIESARIPLWETVSPAVIHHEELLDFYGKYGGQPWPQELVDAAQKDLDEFVHILEAEGVNVRRPTPAEAPHIIAQAVFFGHLAAREFEEIPSGSTPIQIEYAAS